MLEQFDASRLEELAESLLADVITDLGEAPAAGGRRAAAHEGAAERLPGPVVGSQPVQLEPAEDSRRIGGCLMQIVSAMEVEPTTTSRPAASEQQMTPTTAGTDDDRQLDQQVHASDENTLYGSYDEQNHCITIVVHDGAHSMAFGEAVEEVRSFELEHNYVSKIPLLSPIPPTEADRTAVVDDLDDDVVYDGDRRDRMPTAGPMAPMSDCGYESLIASPLASRPANDDEHQFDCASSLDSGRTHSVGDLDELMDLDDLLWNSSFQELFPSLL